MAAQTRLGHRALGEDLTESPYTFFTPYSPDLGEIGHPVHAPGL
jgi:hypothetical protein